MQSKGLLVKGSRFDYKAWFVEWCIFDKGYAIMIGESYAWTMSIPYTKVTSVHYQTLSKKDTN